jgi:hypothetical protein
MDEDGILFIGDRLADISGLLDLSDADLETARHPTDITKTVRQVTKLIYPDINDRRKMKISTMNKKIVQAIIGNISLYLSSSRFSSIRS